MLGNAGFATLVKVIYPGEPAKTHSLLLGRTVPTISKAAARLFQPRRSRPDRKPDSARFVDVRILATDEVYRSIRVGDS